MTRVVFIDTSVLANILRVPGKDQERDKVVAKMKQQSREGTQFVLPVTAVIECGNHIAQISTPNADRLAVARRFTALLRQVASGTAPWVFNRADWDGSFWTSLLAGASTGEALEYLLQRRVGTGDVAIIAERDLYRRRTGIAT